MAESEAGDEDEDGAESEADDESEAEAFNDEEMSDLLDSITNAQHPACTVRYVICSNQS